MTAVWTPKTPEKSHMWQFMRFVEERYGTDFTEYQPFHRWSIEHPELFWPTMCDYFHLSFDTPPQAILKHSTSMLDARWFEGATFNFAEKLLARNDDHPALICLNERQERDVLSYRELKQRVAMCAKGLKDANVRPGDRVVGVLPNSSYAVIAMLATASIGAVWSSCSPDFGINALIDRFEQIEPVVLFACDAQMYQGKQHDILVKIQAMQQAIPSLTRIVVCPSSSESPQLNTIPHAMLWDTFLQPSNSLLFVSLPFAHPLYILFSSGTTGKPKCIIHSAGGTLLQHIKELGLHTDIHPHDHLLYYTTCGWMMWNWMVSALTFGITLTLYEGSPVYPDPLHLFKIINKENVSIFGTSAKYLSSIEHAGEKPATHFSMNKLRLILSSGSPLLAHQYDFISNHVKPNVQLSSISGGTDIVSCFALGNPLLPVYRGELQSLGLGMNVRVFNEQGESIHQQRGELVCTQPFPSMPLGFWNDHEQQRYKHAYFSRFPNVWTHGDYAEITEHGGLIIYGRSDTTLNPGGIRIGTAEIYRQIEAIPEIVDSVVISQEWKEDERIVLFIRLQDGLVLTNDLQEQIKATLRRNASPRHVPAKIIQVSDIPRTINGKVVELAIKQIVHHQSIQNIESIANPEALEHFRDRIELTC